MRLNSHRRVVHGQPKPEMRKPHPCPHCTYIAGKSSHLKRHIGRKHATSDSSIPERYAPRVPGDNEVLYTLPIELQSRSFYVDMPGSAVDPTAYILGTK